MGTTHRPLDYGSGGTEAPAFIQCINGWEPQIHEMWCLGLYSIRREVHPTLCVEVTPGTVRYFMTNYLAKNGRIIKIIRQLSVNDSVQFWGLPDQAGGSGFPFICNLLDHVEATGWESGKYPNQEWGGRFNNPSSIMNIIWGTSADNRQYHLPRSHVNPCAAWRHIRNNFLCHRC